MRNRYYDPSTGQFTQTDPIGLAGGLNAYGFAAGDPVSYSDPYGLKADSITFSSEQLERLVRGTVSRSWTMRETLEDMSGNPGVIVNFGEKDLDNPGEVDDPYRNARGQMVINVWFDFEEIDKLLSVYPQIRSMGGITIDDVIGHETYGHAQPLHEGWDCRDETGCARNRENFLRLEFGHPQRTF